MHQLTGSDYPGPAEGLDSAFLGFHFIVWMLMGCMLLSGAVPSKVVMSNHVREKNLCEHGVHMGTLLPPQRSPPSAGRRRSCAWVVFLVCCTCLGPTAHSLPVLWAQFRGEAVDGSGGISEPLFCSLRCRRVGMTHAAYQNLLANVSSVVFKHIK